MGVVYRMDCDCGTGVVVRDRALAQAIEAHRATSAEAFTVACPLCGSELYTYAEAEPLDLGLLRETAAPWGGRRP